MNIVDSYVNGNYTLEYKIEPASEKERLLLTKATSDKAASKTRIGNKFKS